jgi:hypothetical protein
MVCTIFRETSTLKEGKSIPYVFIQRILALCAKYVVSDHTKHQKRPIMLSSSTEWCAASLEEQGRRQGYVWAGFMVAWIIGIFARRCCLKSKMTESPAFASLYFLVFGLILVIGSFVCFFCGVPSCPSGCECSGKPSAVDYMFPIAMAFKSGEWLGKVEYFLHASSARRGLRGDSNNVDTELTIPYSSMI